MIPVSVYLVPESTRAPKMNHQQKIVIYNI